LTLSKLTSPTTPTSQREDSLELTTPKSTLTSAVHIFIYSELPEVGKYPNTHFWYLFINSFSNDLMKKWIAKANKGEAKEVKTETAQKAADEDDLFGDDDTPAPVAKKAEPKKKKEKPAAKSIVVFDVKVYEQETDLLALFEKIKKEIVVDGLVWNNEPKIMPVAFGMNKLQIGCVIEDVKVSVEDFYEKIEEWEDVQSIDTVSFQKL
jgi:elongation factor 1-beta